METRQRRVLVADDDLTIRNLLGEALADEGHVVRTAANGQEALAILRAWQPDLIVLDLMMPVMDGWAFRAAQQAQPDSRDIPVLLLSATRDLVRQREVLRPAAMVPKPFDLDAVLALIDRLLADTDSG